MKPSDAKLNALARQPADLQKRAKALGVFANGREPLERPRCGRAEPAGGRRRGVGDARQVSPDLASVCPTNHDIR
jgi:hypothetical protein